MANYPISTVTQRFDLLYRFGSCELDILASETIFVSKEEGVVLRTTVSLYNILSVVADSSYDLILSQNAGSTINSSDFRLNERVVLKDAGNNELGFGIVNDTSATDITISVATIFNDLTLVDLINSLDHIDVSTDDFITENRPLEVHTEDVPFLMMASSTGGSIDVNDVTFLKKKLNLGGGGGGPASTYSNAIPTPATIGGINSGTTFTNQTMQQMWDALLYPYQSPAFTSFSLNGGNTFEVGDTLASNRTASWTTSNPGNINPNSLIIRDVTNAVDLATGLANDGSEALVHAAITHNTPASHVFRISGVNTQSGTFTRNHSKNWYWALYYGEDANAGPLMEADIESLRVKLLTGTFARTYAFQAGPTYKYIAYPASFGTATNFTDTGSGFAVAMEAPYTVTVVNSFGQTINYRVHRTTNILNSATNIAVS